MKPDTITILAKHTKREKGKNRKSPPTKIGKSKKSEKQLIWKKELEKPAKPNYKMIYKIDSLGGHIITATIGKSTVPWLKEKAKERKTFQNDVRQKETRKRERKEKKKILNIIYRNVIPYSHHSQENCMEDVRKVGRRKIDTSGVMCFDAEAKKEERQRHECEYTKIEIKHERNLR